MQTAVTRCFTNLRLRFSSKETPLRVLRPRQADVKSPLISPRPQSLTEELFAQASCGVIPSQCSHWRGNPFPAPAGAASPPSAREAARSAGRRDVVRPHPRCSSVGGDAHAVERNGTSTLGVHRPAVFASYSGRTEPSAPTHVLMCRVSVPCLSLWERWPSAARTERANHDHTGPLSHLR